jgi:hypothetical protein
MNVTETEIPDTQDRESNDSAQTVTAPKPDTAANTAQEAIADLPADFTTTQHMAEGVRRGGVIQKAAGSLTISPDQKILTPEQKAAFSSLGVDPNDDVARAHVRRLVHVCQLWNLDPWSNEIYLVQRGSAPRNPSDEDKRTWTIQTGIEGYRKRARTTGRWMGTAKWYWSGVDDDENSWRESTDPITGDLVMRRVWWEAWPTRRGNPGMAKAVIQVYGEDGVLRTEEFVAHWERYAAYEDVWEGSYPNRRRKLDAEGNRVQKPGKFWGPGSGHEQLAKCAEAAVLRQAFSNLYHGVYTAEEMSRADTDAARDLEDAASQRRREAFRKAQESADDVIADTRATGGDADEIRGAALLTAAHIAERTAAPSPVISGTVEPDGPEQQVQEPPRVADVFNHLAMTEEDRVRHLLQEISWIGDELNQRLDVAIVRRARKNLESMDSAELLRWVGPLREKMIIPHLRATDRAAMADAYAAFGPHYIGSPDVLTGLADPRSDLASVQPHPFDPREDDDARCSECGGFEDDALHGGLVAAPPD